MNFAKMGEVLNRYKKCPNCKATHRSGKFKAEVINETIKFTCECGWKKNIDENNNEIKEQ